MSKSDTRGENPNATIQLSALDAVELVQFDTPDPADGAAAPPRSHAVPPPLPPAPAAPQTSRAPAPPPASGGSRTLMYAGIFVVLLGGAVAAGLAVGSYARARRQPAAPPAVAAPTPTVAPVATAAPVPPSASAPHALVIPTVEVSSPSP
jgi:hypothetical protein